MIAEKRGLEYFAAEKCSLYKHYRALLTAREQRVYNAICKGLLNYDNKFDVESVSDKQLSDIFQKIVHDNPNLFYVESLSFRKSFIFNKKVIEPKYRFGKDKANDTLCAIIDKCNLILKGCENLTQLQKEKRVHDYFCNNITYDEKFAESSFECVGPLLFGKGVCEGISKAAKLLLDFAGVKSLVLHGSSSQAELAKFTKNSLHAWNIVCINGNFHHVDITFDLTLQARKITRYDYFNLSDEEMQVDHKVISKGVPKCNKSENYYKANNLFFNTRNDYKKHLIKSLAKNEKDIVFKLPKPQGKDIKHTTRDIIDITQKAIENGETALSEASFKVMYNKYQYVFHLYFDM